MNCNICENINTSLSNVQNAKNIGVSETTIRRHIAKPCSEIVNNSPCGICQEIDPNLTTAENAELIGVSDSTIRRHMKAGHETARLYGMSVRNPATGTWYKYDIEKPEPKWPVIRPANPVVIRLNELPEKPARNGFKMSLKCGDNQIGYRILEDGTVEEFHDQRAMDLVVEVARREQPDSIVILGDFLDLPSQGRWAQEAAFAKTTQKALDKGHEWLASLRAVAPEAEIVLVEGNHDKRLQMFIETNAVSAFGLRRAQMPKSWPVMSLQNLLRLDELGVIYYDAYPAATHWDNSFVRNIHGTRANARGSTTAQYAQELPHISTWSGHSHRCEITYKTVMGSYGEPIRSFSANPGSLCKTDGTVPGFNSATHSDGSSARIVEDWQNGLGIMYYNDEEAWPFVYRIEGGKMIYKGEVLTA